MSGNMSRRMDRMLNIFSQSLWFLLINYLEQRNQERTINGTKEAVRLSNFRLLISIFVFMELANVDIMATGSLTCGHHYSCFKESEQSLLKVKIKFLAALSIKVRKLSHFIGRRMLCVLIFLVFSLWTLHVFFSRAAGVPLVAIVLTITSSWASLFWRHSRCKFWQFKDKTN